MTAKPWKRWKIHGFVEEDDGTGCPYVRLYLDDEDHYFGECSAQLRPGVWPASQLPCPGLKFTLHCRGAKVLYCYVPTLPLTTRAQRKRARIRVRELLQFLSIEDAPHVEAPVPRR